MEQYRQHMQALSDQYARGQALYAQAHVTRILEGNPHVPGDSRYRAVVDWDAKTVTIAEDDTCPYCGGINTHDHCPNCGAPKRRTR